MTEVTLTQVALFLAAAVVAAPLAQLLRIGNLLGYLLVGVLIGPFGVGFVYSVYEVSSVLHFAQFGRGAAALPDRPRIAAEATVGDAYGHLRPGRSAGEPVCPAARGDCHGARPARS